MNVNLTPRLESMVRQKVDSGLYNNSSEVVREALRLMEERDRFEALRQAVALGDADIASGDVFEWTADTMDRIKLEADRADAAGLPIADHVKP